jgi:glycosyltransferase involved in cell wall biosynthesis
MTFLPDVVDGAGRVFREYYDYLTRNGHHVSVVAGLWKERINDLDVFQFKVSNKKIIGFLQFIIKVRKFLKRYGTEFDVIHCNGQKSAFPLVLLRGLKGICTIHDLRCFESKSSYLERIITRFVSKRVDKILADSNEVKKQFKQFLPKIDQNKIEILHVGVNERFKNLKIEGMELKNRLECKKKVLLYIGRIAEYKGLESIINVYHKLKDDFNDLTFIVGGLPDFSMKKRYEDWKERFSDIKFVGFVPDEELPIYYSMADLFITYPDKGEGFGLTPVEALSCETPVVCSDLNVFREILGESGLYVPVKSEEMLYYYIKWFFRNGIHVDFSAWKSEQTLEKYQWKKIIHDLEYIYDNFIYG